MLSRYSHHFSQHQNPQRCIVPFYYSRPNYRRFSEELKKRLSNRDLILQSYTSNLRFALINNKNVVEDAKRRHLLNQEETKLLGKSLTAVSLMASFLNGEERVRLKFMGDGNFLEAESIHVGEVRGYIESEKDTIEPLSFGKGLMTVSKVLYGLEKPLISTTEIVKGDVVTDFEHFFEKSEQIPSTIALETELDSSGKVLYSGGILLQTLPKAPNNIIEQAIRKIQQNRPLSLLNGKTSLYDLIPLMLPDGEIASVLPKDKITKHRVDFHCRCSKSNFERALLTVDKEQLLDWINKEEKLEANCHYCNTNYVFEKKDLLTLLEKKQ